MRPRETDAARLFEDAFGRQPDLTVAAPGRVNLLGDHTDYNDGFVVPAAIDRYLVLAMASSSDPTIRLVSDGQRPASFDSTSLEKDAGWPEYVKGVVWTLGQEGRGWDGAFVTDIPIGAGLSSSAALEIAVGAALNDAFRLGLSPTELAVAGQRAENEWVGMECGLMDQLAVALPNGPAALLIDCSDMSHREIPIGEGLSLVVLDTTTSRNLTASPYNRRRSECASAANDLGVDSLREVTSADLPRIGHRLDHDRFRRVRHVVTENERVLAAATAMERGDGVRVGRLMAESHASLRDDYEASTKALDAIVEAALDAPGCLGARMTGAGWGGCGVALVSSDAVEGFMARTADRYRSSTGLVGRLYPCVPVAGATVHATTEHTSEGRRDPETPGSGT